VEARPGEGAPMPQPLATLVHAYPAAGHPMARPLRPPPPNPLPWPGLTPYFPLNAATKVEFEGDHFVHALVCHHFSGEAPPRCAPP